MPSHKPRHPDDVRANTGPPARATTARPHEHRHSDGLCVELDGPQPDRGTAPTIDRARDRHLLATTGIRTVRFVPDDAITDVARTLTALLVR